MNLKTGMDVDVLYPRCGLVEETVEHFIFESELSKRVWKGSNLGIEFTCGTPVSVTDWFRNAGSDESVMVFGLCGFVGMFF